MNRLTLPQDLAEVDDSAQRIGQHLVDMGRLSPPDAERVAREQVRFGSRFGETAVRLGLVKPADVQHALALQYNYPSVAPSTELMSAELRSALEPLGRLAESMRTLRTELVLKWRGDRAPKTLAVVGAERGDGRTFIAANLAIAFAQMNQRTLLIDMDMRNPRQHVLFQLPAAKGLSNVLSGRETLSGIHSVDPYDSLSVLAAGPTPPNPQELLAERQLSPVLMALQSLYEVIVIDTPAWCLGADAQLIGAQIGSSLLVSRPGHSRKRPTRELVEALGRSGSRVVGAVMNEHA